MIVSDRGYRWLSFAVLAAYAAVQSVALMAPWFPADDMQELAFVRLAEGWTGLLGVDAFGLFRPVKNLAFFCLSGLESCGMPAVRAFAVAIGLATFFPVRAFFRRVFDDRRYALAATAVWMLAPTLVSSVVWLSCINIQLMCAFAAGAIVLHDRGRPVIAALLVLLACVSYESAVAVGPCIVVFDFFLRPSRMRERGTYCTYAFYAAVTLAFLVVRHFVGSVHAVNGSFANCTRMDIVFASAYISWQHFLSWIWPFGRMAVFGGYAAGSVPPFVLVSSWLAIAAVAAAALVLRRRSPAVAFGLAVSLVGFLPVSNVTGVGNGPYGDYYLGIASFGLATASVALCTVRIARPFIAVLRVAAFIAAFHWAWLWADGDRAYFAAAENFPEFFGNKIVLVKRLADAGLWDASLELGREVESTVGAESGQMSDVYLVRGLHALQVVKNADQAIAFFEKSRKGDDFGGAGRNRDYYIGCVYEDLKDDTEKAAALYASSLRGRWTGDSVPAADRYARILAIKGDLESAIPIWEKALLIDPDNESVRHNLSQARSSLKCQK